MSATAPDGRIHFIGVGGAGMSAVAWLMHAAGAEVTGTDSADGPYLRALAERGLDVTVGHDAARVAGAAAVVITSAVKPDNVELVAARQAGIAVWHRSQALARAVAGKRVIAVAGAHGKTTTSAMTAHALRASGIDASFAIGAPVPGVEGAVGGAYAGVADVAVIEADESDGSFLAYLPEVAIITNVEADHLDHYGTPEAVEDAFHDFAASARTLIACQDDPGAARVAQAARLAGVKVRTYGALDDVAITVGPERVSAGGTDYALDLPVPGWHNRLNAAAAWAAAVELGADPATAAAALATYPGTGRRFELRGEAHGVRVIDDYAHHPTEIRALLAAVAGSHDGQVVVLFQPHLYSRTRLLADDFGAALSLPGAAVVVAGIFGAREEPEPGINASTIASRVDASAVASVDAVEDLRTAAQAAAALAKPGALVLTVGAGSVTDAADWILTALHERAGR